MISSILSAPFAATKEGERFLSQGLISDILELALELCPVTEALDINKAGSGSRDNPVMFLDELGTSSSGIQKRRRAKRRASSSTTQRSIKRRRAGTVEPKFVVVRPSPRKQKAHPLTYMIGAYRAMAEEFVPIFIQTCQKNGGRMSIQELCVKGVTRLLPLLGEHLDAKDGRIAESKIGKLAKEEWECLQGISSFLIALMRTGRRQMVISAIRIAEILLSSDDAATFHEKFRREGVLATAWELATPPQDFDHKVVPKRSRGKSKRLVIKRAAEEVLKASPFYTSVVASKPKEICHSGGFTFLPPGLRRTLDPNASMTASIFLQNALKIANTRPHPMMTKESPRKMQKSLPTGSGRMIKDDKRLEARDRLDKLAKKLRAFIPKTKDQIRSKLLPSAYGPERKALTSLRKVFDTSGFATMFELLSSQIISALAEFLGTSSPESPASFDYARPDPKDYKSDACLQLRRAVALECLFVEDNPSVSRVPEVVSCLLKGLEGIESFSVRLDASSASNSQAAVDAFAKPLRLRIVGDPNSLFRTPLAQSSSSRRCGGRYRGKSQGRDLNLQGIFAIDPLTTIGSIAGFLLREYPHLLLPPPAEMKEIFPKSSRYTSKNMPTSSRSSIPTRSSRRRAAALAAALDTAARRPTRSCTQTSGPWETGDNKSHSPRKRKRDKGQRGGERGSGGEAKSKETGSKGDIEVVRRAWRFARGRKIDISMKGNPLPPSMSIYEAVQTYGLPHSSSHPSSGSTGGRSEDVDSTYEVQLVDASRAWDIVHQLDYSVSQPEDSTLQPHKPSGLGSLDAPEIVRELVGLLQTLREICLSADHLRTCRNDMILAEREIKGMKREDSNNAHDSKRLEKDKFSWWERVYSAKLSAKMMRQLSDPLIVCSATGVSASLPKATRNLMRDPKNFNREPPGKTGIPSWVHWIAQNASFLLSPTARALYFKTTGFSSPQHLQHIEAHLKGHCAVVDPANNATASRSQSVRSPFRGTLGVPLEYRVKHVKVLTRRENALEAACQLLDHHATDRCSIRAEFVNEKGVGLGPTVEFFALASREFQKRDLRLWRDDRSEPYKTTKRTNLGKSGRTASRTNRTINPNSYPEINPNSKGDTRGEAKVLYFVVRRCLGCHLIDIPHCKSHRCLLTRLLSSGHWACPKSSCAFSTKILRTKTESGEGGWKMCRVCGERTELMEWGLTKRECEYLIQSYPPVKAFPHIILKCHSCGCVNFPGSQGRLHANAGGRLLSNDGNFASDSPYRDVFDHSLRCCVGAALHQYPSILLNSSIQAIKTMFDVSVATSLAKARGLKRDWKGDIKCESGFSDYVLAQAGLFPAAVSPKSKLPLMFSNIDRLGIHPDLDHALRSPLSLFTNIGRLIAQALLEGRILDSDFSPTLLQSLVGNGIRETMLRDIDKPLSKSLERLVRVARVRKHYCEMGGDQSIEDRKAFQVDGIPIKDLFLNLVAPGMQGKELVEGGRDIMVDIHNISEYLSKVYKFVLCDSVKPQICAMRDGFNEISSTDALKVFTSEEMIRKISGERSRSWDFSRPTLVRFIKCTQGYTLSSQAIGFLFEILQDMDTATQQKFIQFLTGCPRLPAGQLSSLRPPITIVRVPWSVANPNALPLASTCSNFLKLPDYPSKELMRERIYYSIAECPYGFQLS
ncbi:hypothetical protein AAMO2058_001582600 [Amorphochlora amoebiformis]